MGSEGNGHIHRREVDQQVLDARQCLWHTKSLSHQLLEYVLQKQWYMLVCSHTLP